MKIKPYLALLAMISVTMGANAATEVIRLAPDQYNIFLFNNGAGYIVVDGPLSNYVTPALQCDLNGDGIAITTEMSDRVIANLLAAKASESYIFLQVTDDGVASTGSACTFNGSTYIGKTADKP